MKNIIPSILATAVLGMMGVASARADDGATYANSLRLGFYSVFYHTKADDLSGDYVPAGLNFKAVNLETLYAAYVRSLGSKVDVELAFGYPPLSKVDGKGPATVGSVPFNGQEISSARWISPTVLIEYKFFNQGDKLRPYVGVGVNYTTFYDRTSTAQGNAASGGPTRLSLTPSVGPAATAGVSYAFSSHWHAYASYSITRVNSRIDTETAGLLRTTNIHFGPQALVISGGYSF